MENRKNLGIVIPTLMIGGCQRSVSNISLALEKYYNVSVINFSADENVYGHGGKIIDMRLGVGKNLLIKGLNSFLRLHRLKRIIKREKLDVVYLFLNPLNVLNYCVFKGCRKFVSCRGFGDLLAWEKHYLKMAEKSDGIIFNSYGQEAYFSEKYPALKDKIKVVNNLYDLSLIEKQRGAETDRAFDEFVKTRRTVVSVGRFCWEKGFNHLIKSFRILKETVKDAGLVLIGDGALFEDLKQMAQDSGCAEDILFLGYQGNPYNYMAKCDVYALSSLNEGFPNVVVEAMSVGLAVACANCDSGPNEILNQNYVHGLTVKDVLKAEYGILLPVFDKNGDFDAKNADASHALFAGALQMLLEDDALRKHYREKSLERARSFGAENIAREFVKIFH